MSIPAQQPEFPWAVYLTGSDQRFRLLGFDFDSGHHGRGIALEDSDRLASQLTELGVAHLRTHSGPTGGQHVWVRLAETGADPDNVRLLAHALRHHYPSLDTSALTNPATGAVRPPGAPHRAGGRSTPHLQGQALLAALDEVGRGTTPEVVTWLIARHPHVEPHPSSATRRFPSLRIVEDSTGPRLDRPRRPLPHRTAALLSAAPKPGVDRSALAHTIFLSMARAGQSLDDARAAVAAAPGLIRLREDAARGSGDTERQWSRAVTRAATFTADPGQVPRAPIDDELDGIEQALVATAAHWGRRGGASDERILHALTVFARTARTRVLDIDCRRLAQACALDASTVSRRLRVLAGEGWVTLTTPSAGTRAATWTLNLPSEVGIDISHATQGEPAPAPGSGLSLLAHHTHDLWSHHQCGGLGAATARVHWFYKSGVDSLDLLSMRTGYGTEFIERALHRLYWWGLLGVKATGEKLLRVFEIASNTLGVAGLNARRADRHLVDRELFTWWNEEQQWRTTRGKKRGTRRTTSTETLALPISAPARVRYGRFPIKSNGKADYATARAIVTQASSIGRSAA